MLLLLVAVAVILTFLFSMQKSKRASFGATDNAAAAAERRSRIAAIEEEKRERALHKEVITKEPDVRIHPEELQKIDEMARTLSIRMCFIPNPNCRIQRTTP